MPLPIPVPQTVNNMGPSIGVVWRPLDGTLNGRASLRDAAGTVVASATSQGGQPTCSIPALASYPNPPYTIVVAATDGTSFGDPSPPVPLLLAPSTFVEVRYDQQVVEMTVQPPAGSTDLQHAPTLYVANAPQNFPPFAGLVGQFPLASASATTAYDVAITDLQVVAVQSPYSCTSFSPVGGRTGIITQPATIQSATYVGPNYEVDATGPTSVGPAITGHRLRYGAAGATAEIDVAVGAPRKLPGWKSAPATPPMLVEAAGINITQGIVSRGPFSAAYYLITDAPTGVRLVFTTTDRLRAAWTAIPPLPPPLDVLYEATLFRDGVAIEKKATTQPGTPTVEFTAALAAGALFTTSVTAQSTAKSSGPPSAAVRGPFRAVAAAIVYDPIGRLRTLPVTGLATYEYTYDDAGNIRTAVVTPAPRR